MKKNNSVIEFFNLKIKTMKKIILVISGLLIITTSFAQKRSRSAETGRYVSGSYVKQNPKTTVTESGGNNNSSTRSRSSETGRYTTKGYSNQNSSTTVTERPKRNR